MKRVSLILVILLVGIILFDRLQILRKEKPVEPKKEGGETITNLKLKMKSEKRVLLVVAPQNFRDEEYQKPRQVLENAGITVEVAAKGVSEAVGMFGAKAIVDKDISQVNVDDYEGVVFVGGTGAAVYFDDSTALGLVKSAFEKEKVVGAICIAPSILANAGVLEGKGATAFSTEVENLQAKGAQYTGEAVTVDGKIVTANGPQAAEDFGKKVVEILERG